jgi:hypothetical protein
MVFCPMAVVLRQDTTHRTTLTIKDMLHTVNTMQIELILLQLTQLWLIIINDNFKHIMH